MNVYCTAPFGRSTFCGIIVARPPAGRGGGVTCGVGGTVVTAGVGGVGGGVGRWAVAGRT